MKKYITSLIVVALGILFVSSLVMAGTNPGTGIKQTSHDLSMATGKGATWAPNADPTLDRICIYCHAPHHSLTSTAAASAGINYYPLWNHQLSAITSYTMYSNGTELPNSIQQQLNATLGQPGSVSKLCLSCHDGNVAISAYGYAPASSIGNPAGPKASGRILIGGGGDLSNHHPIGFDYTAVAAIDDEIKDPSSALLGNNPYALTVNDLLWSNKMECSSCHDVHNTKNTGLKFLWVEDTNSNLCFSCHAK